jgi:O-succinylbenzoate synthase
VGSTADLQPMKRSDLADLLGRGAALDCDGVEVVRLHRVAVPLRTPLHASHGVETHRRSTLVELRDAAGAVGWGECPALARPTYSAEYAAGAWRVLADELVPAALAGRGLEIRGHAMARFAVETALVDMHLRVAGVALADALATAVGSGRRRTVERCVVLGRPMNVESMQTDAEAALAGGARLVKLKIEPGWDLAPLCALRAAHPGLPLAADANGAYAGLDPATLSWVEEIGLTYLEQPLAPDDLVGHARLQRHLQHTPLALDESAGSAGLVEAAVALGAAWRFSLKPARLGGLHASARLTATTAGCFVGGMLELGVGRAAALAVASLDGCALPTDLGPSSSYVAEDVTEPIVVDARGDLVVPDQPGLGVEVRRDRVAELTSEVVELRP